MATTVDEERKGLAGGAEAYAVKPINRRWLLQTLRNLVGARVVRHVLVIDDDEAARYLLRELLDDISCVVGEAATGAEG